MRARPAALGAEESARCPPSLPSPPLTCPSEFLGLHEEHICEHICLLLHASLRQIIGTYAADVACTMNGKAPNTSQHNPEQRVQKVHREQEIEGRLNAEKALNFLYQKTKRKQSSCHLHQL